MDLSLNKNATRLLTGLIVGTIVLWCLLYGGIALLAILLFFIFVGSKEFVQILKNKGFFPSIHVILFSDLIFALLCYFNRFDLVAVAFSICSLISFLWVLFRGRQPYIANVATTILGFVYGGWFPLHLILLRGMSAENYQGFLKLNIQNDGLGYVVFLFMTILLTDTGCYYFGKHFGKHKLAPIISPKKTIEGSIGGATCAIITALIIGHFINLSFWNSLILGILCTTFAQIGDLCESMLKRDAGVKDSGDMLPGHGGFMDRADSYILTIPVMYYYLQYFVVTNQIGIDFINFILRFFHSTEGMLHAIGL